MPGNRSKATSQSEDKELPAWVKGFQAALLESIQNMIDKSSIQLRKDIDADMQKAIDNLQESIKPVEAKTNELTATTKDQELKIVKLQQNQQDMAERLIDVECRMMRNNLIFTGLPEEVGETNNMIQNMLQDLFTHELKLENSIRISHCHRLAKRRHQHTRDIIAIFDNVADCQAILYNSKRLKGHQPPVYINQQYPFLIEKRRAILRPIMKLARTQNKRAFLVRDKIIIDDRFGQRRPQFAPEQIKRPMPAHGADNGGLVFLDFICSGIENSYR